MNCALENKCSEKKRMKFSSFYDPISSLVVGLLSMVVELYLNGLVPDILLFPLSISYERTLEEDLFAWELLGIPKPKESTTVRVMV